MNSSKNDKAQELKALQKKTFLSPSKAYKETTKSNYQAIPNQLFRISKASLTLHEKSVFMYLCGNKEGFNPSLDDIAEFSHVSRSIVPKILKKLESHGMIRITKRGVGLRNSIEIGSAYAWKNLVFNHRCKPEWVDIETNTIEAKAEKESVNNWVDKEAISQTDKAVPQPTSRPSHVPSQAVPRPTSSTSHGLLRKTQIRKTQFINTQKRKTDKKPLSELDKIGQGLREETGKCPALEIMIQHDFLNGIYGWQSEAKLAKQSAIARKYYYDHGAECFLEKIQEILNQPNFREFKKFPIESLLEENYSKSI